jgi:hypothetical protein
VVSSLRKQGPIATESRRQLAPATLLATRRMGPGSALRLAGTTPLIRLEPIMLSGLLRIANISLRGHALPLPADSNVKAVTLNSVFRCAFSPAPYGDCGSTADAMVPSDVTEHAVQDHPGDPDLLDGRRHRGSLRKAAATSDRARQGRAAHPRHRQLALRPSWSTSFQELQSSL